MRKLFLNKRRAFSLFLFSLIFISYNIFSTPVVEITDDSEVNVLNNIEYSMRFGDIEFSQKLESSAPEDWKKMARQEIFLYNTPDKNLWMRFDIKNSYHEQLFLIRIKEFLFDYVECFIYHKNGDFKHLIAGNDIPLRTKTIYSIDSIYSIYLPNNDSARIYLKFKSNLLTTSYIRVQPLNRFLDWNARENFLLGGYYGFLIFTCILSMGIFFYLKDYAYFYFAIFQLFYGLFDFSRNSLSVYYFFPEYPSINIKVWYTFLILSLSAGSVFSRSFLNLQKYNPLMNKILFYSSLVILFFIPIPYIFTETIIYIIPPIALIYLLIIYSASFYVFSKGFAPAKYFIIGWGATIFGVLISFFASRFFIWAEYGSQVGSTMEIFFIVFAMLSRANKTQEEKREIEEVATDYKREFTLAAEIQQSLLPKDYPKIKGFDINSFFLPMKAIGGDYYDFHQKNEHSFSIIMADVSGHGPSAALIASMVKLSFTETFGLYDRPEKAVRKMNASLMGNLGKKFVTAMYAHINYRNLSLTYCSAGHPPILIHRRSEDKIIQLDSRGQFLGWFNDIKLREHTYKIMKGDRIIIYTDGLTEAFNKEQEMFDYDRLEQTLRANENFSAQELTYFLIYRIKEWVGINNDFGDDITFTIIDVL